MIAILALVFLSFTPLQAQEVHYRWVNGDTIPPARYTEMLEEIEACTGMTRPAESVVALEVFALFLQEVEWGLDPVRFITGLTLSPDQYTGDTWLVIIVRNVPGREKQGNDFVLRHELTHYVTTMWHPEVDSLMKVCAPDPGVPDETAKES